MPPLGGSVVSPIRTKIEAESWLEKRLRQEGVGLWTEAERKELSDQLAREYRPPSRESKWRVEPWTQKPEGTSVYVVTRGGLVGIHTGDNREKADAIMRALNALDTEMRPTGSEPAKE